VEDGKKEAKIKRDEKVCARKIETLEGKCEL